MPWLLRALACLALGAASGATVHAQWTFEFAPTVARYDAVERLPDGRLANRERGDLAGAKLALEWHGTQGLPGGLRPSFAWTHLRGEVAYSGRTQIGFPIRTHTDVTLDDWALHAGIPLVDMGSQAPVAVALDVGFGWRRIDRRIAPSLLSTPLSEKLDWRYLQFGATGEWQPAAGWHLRALGRFERGVSGRLAVDFHGMGDAVTLAPTAANGFLLALEVERELAARVSVVLGVTGQRQRYGGSRAKPFTRNGVNAGTVRYPGSRQTTEQLRLGLRVRLD